MAIFLIPPNFRIQREHKDYNYDSCYLYNETKAYQSCFYIQGYPTGQQQNSTLNPISPTTRQWKCYQAAGHKEQNLFL